MLEEGLEEDQVDQFDEVQRNMNTFAGTPLYVSPEMLNDNIACYGSDLWALGCILFQCLVGKTPF